MFFVIGIGLASGANQFLIAIIATFVTIVILFIRKFYYDKINKDNYTELSTNIIQIQFFGKKQNTDEILSKIKKNVNYLNLKSFSSDKDSRIFNFWFDINKKNLNIFLNDIEKITSENDSVNIQIFSRSGIYE